MSGQARWAGRLVRWLVIGPAAVAGLAAILAGGPVLLCSDPAAARDHYPATDVKSLLLRLAGLPIPG